ncbi:sugar kinase [Streptomyces griseus]|uniref:sugar kinase n=1 Tax=Streptomyces griseus TaxID=1911 RepID=UPI00055E1CD6|nr:sugar kinase [Streptomyces griseus]
MTPTGHRDAPDVDAVDVVALGESMVTFLPSRAGRLADVPSFDRAIGGAESNVVCTLAAAGHTTRWVSSVGADGFGDHLVKEIGAYGVDVTSVRRDPTRPTGVYFRTAGDRATDAHEVAYYRAGSAASAMSARTVDLPAVRAGRVLHLSGITPALSDDCLALMWELTEPRPGRPLVSFDVNHRPGLWPDADGPRVLLDLARRADIVFVGEDEAEGAWGVTGGPQEIRALLPEPETLVVKQGARGATLFRHPSGSRATGAAPGGAQHGGMPSTPGRGTRPRPAPAPSTFVPALRVTAVADVGAGDAFAAGFLSATLRGLPVRDRLRHGHLMAAAALTVPGDLATPPARDHADRLAALDDTAWGTLRLGPGWTTRAAHRAAEEVGTP